MKTQSFKIAGLALLALLCTVGIASAFTEDMSFDSSSSFSSFTTIASPVSFDTSLLGLSAFAYTGNGIAGGSAIASSGVPGTVSASSTYGPAISSVYAYSGPGMTSTSSSSKVGYGSGTLTYSYR